MYKTLDDGEENFKISKRNNRLCDVLLRERFVIDTDADWGGDPSQRKSTSRYAFFLNDCAISWGSHEVARNSLV